MKYLIMVLALAGCAEVPPSDLSIMVNADVTHRVASFNALRGVHMPVPQVVFGGSAVGEEFSASNPIYINPDICAKDIEDCLDDTVPHELAHWALDYYGYYHTHLDITPNSRRYEASENAHDGVWCDTMRAFGGVPEKHGYCLNH